MKLAAAKNPLLNTKKHQFPEVGLAFACRLLGTVEKLTTRRQIDAIQGKNGLLVINIQEAAEDITWFPLL
jgi:hypothetical protein